MAHQQTPARRKLFMRSKELFTREERLEWATYQLRRDVGSFESLTEEEVLRLLDGLEGWHLINALLMLRPEGGTPEAQQGDYTTVEKNDSIE